MGAGYTHTTRANGLVLTHTIYNADHQNHIDNMIPTKIDDHCADVATMQRTRDPYAASTEVLSTTLAHDIENIRYVLEQITNSANWYIDPVGLNTNILASSLTSVGALASGSIASGFGTISTANTITTTALITGSDLTLTADNPDIIGGDTDGVLSITADTATNQGGNIKLYGNTHATLAQDIEFYADATLILSWDESEANWDFASTNVIGVGTLTATTLAGTLSTATQGNITSLGTLTTLTVDDITINANTISSAGASALTITATAGQVVSIESCTFDGGVATISTSLDIASSIAVTGVLDEDTMSSDSAVKLATQQSIKAYVDNDRKTEAFTVAISDEDSDLEVGTAKITFRMPYAFTLTDIRASCTTAPTGATLTIDVNETGSTILSTKLTIDAGEKTSTTATTAVVISDSALADDAEITIDIDQIGSSVAGTGGKVTFIGTRV